MRDLPPDRCRISERFWRAFEHLGLGQDEILSRARILLPRPGAPLQVTTTELFTIWKAVEGLTGDPGFAIRMVEACNVTGHQPAWVAASYAVNLRDAISRILRYKRSGTSEILRIEESEGTFSILKEWPYAQEAEPAVSVDLTFAFVVELARKGTGLALSPLRVEFSRTAPKSGALGVYFGCPVRYGAPRDRLVWRSSDLALPFPGHHPELLDMLTPALTEALREQEAPATLGEQIKAHLKRTLATGRPELGRVASDWGMGERTLQRRIAQEGKSFRTLVDEARQEMARALLSDPALALDQVSFLLGFQDGSSFFRWFREWEGTTPLRWRASANDATGQVPLASSATFLTPLVTVPASREK